MRLKLLIFFAFSPLLILSDAPLASANDGSPPPVEPFIIHTAPNYPPDQEERYECRWNLATMSKPYIMHNDQYWEVGVKIVKDWHKSNFPWVESFRPGPFLLGNTSHVLTTSIYSPQEILQTPTSSYNSALYDTYIKNLIESGVKPIINLCGTPRCLISNIKHDSSTLYHIVEPPDVIVGGRWQSLIEEIYRRFTNWGLTDSRFDPSQWEFASWMEPHCDKHYRGEIEDMLQMIKTSYDALVNASPTGVCSNFRLGNFYSPDPQDWKNPHKLSQSYLERSWADDIIPDLISDYNMTYGPDGDIKAVGLSLYEVASQDRDFQYINDSLDTLDQIIKDNVGDVELPILIDEVGYFDHWGFAVHWNPTVGKYELGHERERVPSFGGIQGLAGASWHAKLVHMVLSKSYEAVLSPWSMEHYWRGIRKGSGRGQTNHWLKLGRHNIYDMYEELCGAVKLEHDVNMVCEYALGVPEKGNPTSFPNDMREVRWIQGTAGKASDGSVVFVVFHHARDLDNHTEETVTFRFEDLTPESEYFVEIYGMDAYRGSAYEQLLREWGRRVQAAGGTLTLSNGLDITSTDLQELEAGEFYYLKFWDPTVNPPTGSWSKPLRYEPYNSVPASADLDNLLETNSTNAVAKIQSLQRSDEYYLMESSREIADDLGGIDLNHTLPHHSVRLIRITPYTQTSPTIDEFEVHFEKNLVDVYGRLPDEAQNLSYERGVEHSDPGLYFPGKFWTSYKPTNIYPPIEDVFDSTVGNGTDAIRAMRITRFSGQDPKLSYTDHPFDPTSGSLDLWVKPDWDSESINDDDVIGPDNDHCLFSWSSATWQNEFRLWVWQKRILCADWWINGVRHSLPIIIDADSSRKWNMGVWHRISLRWKPDTTGSSYTMDLWMDGDVVGSLQNIPLDQLSTHTGPVMIGLIDASGDAMRSFEGVIDNVTFSQDPARYYPGP